MHKHPRKRDKRDPLCSIWLERKPADSLISSEAPEGTLHAGDLILIIKQNEDKQRLGMKLGKLHFTTLSSNNSTPIDKLDVVLCLAKC